MKHNPVPPGEPQPMLEGFKPVVGVDIPEDPASVQERAATMKAHGGFRVEDEGPSPRMKYVLGPGKETGSSEPSKPLGRVRKQGPSGTEIDDVRRFSSGRDAARIIGNRDEGPDNVVPEAPNEVQAARRRLAAQEASRLALGDPVEERSLRIRRGLPPEPEVE